MPEGPKRNARPRAWRDWHDDDVLFRTTCGLFDVTQTKTGSLRSRLRDFHVLFLQIRFSESAPRRGMVSGHHRSGDVPVVDPPWPGSTRSAATRVSQWLRHVAGRAQNVLAMIMMDRGRASASQNEHGTLHPGPFGYLVGFTYQKPFSGPNVLLW